jgi:hypothetical protein
MTNLLKKTLDILIYIKETLFTTFFIIFLFVILVFVLYVVKSVIGIDIFEDAHFEDFLSLIGDFFLALKDFFSALFSLLINK